MKKKLIPLFIIGACVVGLIIAFNNPNINKVNKKATVINKEGKKELLSSQELCNIYNENKAKFKKYYAGAEIEFEGTVNSVDYDIISGSNKKYRFDRIKFKEGFELYLLHNQYDFLADLNKGDVFYVKTNIFDGFACLPIDVRGTDNDGAYGEHTLMKTVIEKK